MERQSPPPTEARVISRVPGTVHLSRSSTRGLEAGETVAVSEPGAPRSRRR